MNTQANLKRINYYLGQLTGEQDKKTQFYEACVIAKHALMEVERLTPPTVPFPTLTFNGEFGKPTNDKER